MINGEYPLGHIENNTGELDVVQVNESPVVRSLETKT